MNGSVETRTEVMDLGPDGVVRCTVKDGARITLEEAHQNIAAVRTLVERSGDATRRVPVLVDGSRARDVYVSREARTFLQGAEVARHQSACAVLVKSAVTAVIGHWFVALSKPAYPMRLFVSEEAAIRWLLGHIADEA